jgi:hypothetical protein
MRGAVMLVFAITAGCVIPPQQTHTWVKAGATEHDWRADSAGCNVYAHQTVPQYQPPVNNRPSSPPNYYCDRAGSGLDCRPQPTYGGANDAPVGAGGTAGFAMGRQRAANEQARNSAFVSCMYQRGWQWQKR